MRCLVGEGSDGGKTLQVREPHRGNSYGFLRLFLASLVIVQHTLVLTGNPGSVFLGFDNTALFSSRVSYGDVAVGGFFALSGFLLYSSVRRHAPGRFIKLRFFRLFPGFWAALVMVAFVFAPLIGWAAGTLDSYRLVGADSAATYTVFNSALLIVQHTIGGVLDGVPYPQSLDGSFWTLLPEFCCYMALLAVWLVGKRIRLFGGRGMFVLVFAGAVCLWPVAVVVAGQGHGEVLTAVVGLPVAFFAGVLLAVFDVPSRMVAAGVRGWFAVAAAAALLTVAVVSGWWMPFGPACLAVVVVGAGAMWRTGWVARVGVRNDYSYGIYLYHFPVIQLLVVLGFAGVAAGAAIWVLAPLTFILAFPFAAASWRLVEGPAQKFARGVRTVEERTP